MKRYATRAVKYLLEHLYPLNRVYQHELDVASHSGYCAAEEKCKILSERRRRELIYDIIGDVDSHIAENVIDSLDLDPHDRKLYELKNKHKGQRCVIVATGPSLRVEDLDRLQNVVCFGCNKIFLAYDRTDWRSDYYTVLDHLVAEQNKDTIQSLRGQKILPRGINKYIDDSNDIIWVAGVKVDQPSFSGNLLRGVCGGYTVIYPQIQMAYYMGFHEVVLIGLDFSFGHGQPTGEKCVHGEVLRGEGELNHFDPRYRPVGEKWSIPRLDLQYDYFVCARDAFEKAGRRILNASRKSALDVFERVSFDDLF